MTGLAPLFCATDNAANKQIMLKFCTVLMGNICCKDTVQKIRFNKFISSRRCKFESGGIHQTIIPLWNPLPSKSNYPTFCHNVARA